ncbi:hypothetical protein P168DRAFT_332219 [Aspergillus campestris IBT 28561]|uniref:MARVEL domain-containing protein n=1 Tax=Aspergillus campestris (strain IBT 28561) TaxID=1392248 RepID=A0A2I1DFK0_ASPC2|nr:uncharacterized protein P168DRAFT_332219 [Aspergillus campestris IBT 28561]PKY08652.1 hypothetical protein P168DRAFT_332219 [Aspergillus campestris IBT 28561]
MGFPARAKWYAQSTNLSLRILTGITSLIALCVFGWANSSHDITDLGYYDLGGPMLSPVIAGTGYTLAWSIIAVCVELLSHKPIHHGVYVTFDLFAWTGLVATIVMYLLWMMPYLRGVAYDCKAGYRDCSGKTLADIEYFGTAVALVTMILYFWLFVRSCISTHKLRKEARLSRKESNDSRA